MTPQEMKEKATELFTKRLHCSQAVLAACQERMGGIDESTIKCMGAFGGGIASSRRVCGALIGGVAFVSTLYSRGNLNDKEDPKMRTMSRELVKRFEELTEACGGVDCADIARTDWSDLEAVKLFYRDPQSRRQECIRVVGETARIIGELLEEDEAAGS